jgi:CDP-glycerol glycerophosphotransferase (TagB/SpsB family)
VDVQEELLVADIMISDYSSIIFDFSILARPILLFTPDKISYFDHRGGSYFDYDLILQECIHIDTSELDSIWDTNFKEFNFTRLMSLHTMFACNNIHDKFN